MKVVMIEQPVSEIDNIPVMVGWVCEGCGAVGAFPLWKYWDTWGVMTRVKLDHSIVAPDCSSIAQFPNLNKNWTLDNGSLMNDNEPSNKRRV